MPNDEIVTKIEELKKICDPNETEATLVHELKQINEKIASIQSQLSELKNIPDVVYYDDIQESRDITRKAELNKQIIELEKKVSLLEIELKDLQTKEEKLHKALEALQQNKNKNSDIVSTVSAYEATLSSSESKDNFSTILKSIEKEVSEDTKEFRDLAVQYKELQAAIEEKADIINSIKENIKNYRKQLEQISIDLANREKYINQEKKNNDLAKITALEKELQSLIEQQAKIVENPIMLISLASKAALDGDLVAILNKIKSVKESLLQKPFMDIPEDSIQEETARAIEDRNTFYSQINGKDYTSKGLPAANERIDDNNAYMAKWIEEVNTLKARKEEIDNGTKYGSARKINEIAEAIKLHYEEVEAYENKESLTSDEEVALDKRKKEIEALRKVLNSYFADQKANIKEAEIIQENIKILEDRIELANLEIKDLRKMSKSLAGIDSMSKKKDSDALQERVNIVMDLKKLPDYRRMLVIVDEILDTLGKNIVVPTIEEKEEVLVAGEIKSPQIEVAKEEQGSEVHPIEEVKADELNVVSSIAEVSEEIPTSENIGEIKPQTIQQIQEKTSGVVFEPAFKEEIKKDMSPIDNELNKEINKVLSESASKVVSSEEIRKEAKVEEPINPFANISDLKTVESGPEGVNQNQPKMETQAIEGVFKEKEPTAYIEPQVASPDEVSLRTPKVDNITAFEPATSTNSIDDFFAEQWGEVSNEDVQTLGKVA